jgi:hypothetical protein
MRFHIKTSRLSSRLSNKLSNEQFLMLKSQKTVVVLTRYGSPLKEKLEFKRQNGLTFKLRNNSCFKKNNFINLNGPRMDTFCG